MEQLVTELLKQQESVTNARGTITDTRLLRTRNNGKPVVLSIKGGGAKRIRRDVTNNMETQIKVARSQVLSYDLDLINAQIGILSNAIGIIKGIKHDRVRFAAEHFSWFSDRELVLCLGPEEVGSWADAPYK